ncbi:MAG: NYN domain-containing protein [Nanoarchaeota archaeon]|jgi:uncharacterized LabA/DUF88 family protein|nr:NYN domain-containing protein [Nanoarchaeota archaeon]
MSKKAIIFIDANNWYHNVKKWVKPSSIDIHKVSSVIAKENNFDVIEIRWYASMPSIKDDPLIYKMQRAFLGHLEKTGVKIILRKLQRLSTKELRRKKEDLMESWDLCNICKPIVENSFLDIADYNQKEKGIDIWIAIDMVKEAFQDSIDSVVLISGDADFVPAFDLIKSFGKDVLSCSVPSGYSNELRQKFKHYILNKDKLNMCLRDWESKK